MANLVTDQEFATFAQADLAEVQDDPWAMMALELASSLVAEEAEQLEWLAGNVLVPFKAKLITMIVARRGWLNPDQEQRTNTGPIGSSLREEAALSIWLSETEKAELALLSPDGGPNSGLWVQRTSNYGSRPVPVFVYDDEGSDWGIMYGDG